MAAEKRECLVVCRESKDTRGMMLQLRRIQTITRMPDYDVIVVGAGIFGSCAAYHAQRLGLKTLLLEQFALGHTNGSSHGMSRIIRYAHTDAPYVPLVRDAYQQIAAMEKKRNEKLWMNTGLLWAAPVAQIDQMSSILKKQNCEHEVIRGSQVSLRFSQFSFTDSVSALVDPMGGVIYANKWLNAFQEEFVELGGKISANTEVQAYNEGEDDVSVQTNVGAFSARKVIFAVGSWLGRLLPETNLKIKPESLAVCYWKPKAGISEDVVSDANFPVFIFSSKHNDMSVFGMPAPDYAGTIKICHHSGDEIEHGGSHPEQHTAKRVEGPQNFVQNHLQVIDPTPFKIDKCKYTMSEDEHYVIGHLPGSRNVIVGGCGSGSGFKVSPGVGRALAELAAGVKTTVDVSFFGFDRFKKL